jgi:hypothetical protein
MERTIENLNKNVLKSLVKNIGWENASKMVGGPETLVRLVFNNNPMQFLNLFNDLDVVQSEKNSCWTLFRYEIGYIMMVHDKQFNRVFINYKSIWLFLKQGFGFSHAETEELTERWLGETYNLRGITTFYLKQWWNL